MVSIFPSFPRARTSILTTLDRITGPITDFIRGNPIVSTAAIGIGTTGLIAGVAAVTRARKKRKKVSKKKRVRTRKRKVSTRKRAKIKKVSRRKRVTHRSPRHKGHKRVAFTTAGGKRVSFLVKKKTRRHSHK